MNDPHVEELIYLVKTEEGRKVENPPPIEEEASAFRMVLENETVTFSMKDHYSNERDARDSVKDYLRAWELDTALRRGGPQLYFSFDKSKIIDRDPPPPGSTINASATLMGSSSVYARATVVSSEYPPPPHDFKVDNDTEDLWKLYERYKEGRDRLLPMAYSFLTRLEYQALNYPTGANKRERVRNMYRVDLKVLQKLGDFTTNLGDEAGARKFDRSSQLRQPNVREVKWIEATLEQLIRRVGQYASDPQRDWPELTMNSLPELN